MPVKLQFGLGWRKIVLLFVLFAVTPVVWQLVKPMQVSAAGCDVSSPASNIFPRAGLGSREGYGCAAADSYLWLSDYSPSMPASPLQTPFHRLRVFYPMSYINSFPAGSQVDSIIFGSIESRVTGGTNITATYLQTGATLNWTRAVGGPWPNFFGIIPGEFRIYTNEIQQDIARYGNTIGFIDIDINMNSNNTVAPIRLLAMQPGTQGRITLREQSRVAAETPEGSVVPDGTNAFGGDAVLGPDGGSIAIWTNDVGDPDERISYNLNFAPDCSVTPETPITVYLKWYDADADYFGNPTQDPGFGWEVIDDTAGGVTIASLFDSPSLPVRVAELGGNDSYRIRGVTILGGHEYRWRWSGMTRSNGIQVWMPFSEILTDPITDCGSAGGLSGVYSATCTNGNIAITADASSSFGNVTIATTVSGGGPNPPDYNGPPGNGLGIGTVFRTPNGTAYTVSGTISSGGSSAAMTPYAVTCDRPPQAGHCVAAAVPSIPEPGELFTIRITIYDDGATDSLRLSSATNPLVAASVSPGLNGAGEVGGFPYNIASAGGTATVNDLGLNGPAGYHTIAYEITNMPVSTKCNLTIQIANKAYFKAFGGDVWSGGGFSGISCLPTAPSGGRIYGFARNTGAGYAGASSQHSVTALLSIGEFYSSSQVVGQQPKGLTFANNAGDEYGGNFDPTLANGRCITDYFNDTRNTFLDRGNHNGNAAFGAGPAGLAQYNMLGDRLGNGASPLDIPDGRQIALYADGDVYIRSNVEYPAVFSGWFDTYPFFALIVRGNIYIDHSVTRLDGLYVAQPSGPGTGGIVYTCARNLGVPYQPDPAPGQDIFSRCSQPLAFNGGVVAQQIKLMRIRGSLQGATVQEGLTNWTTGSSANIAEVFNYTPEMYLAPSPLRRPGDEATETNTSSSRYQYMRQLPPIY